MGLLLRLVLFLAVLSLVAAAGLALFALDGDPLIARAGKLDLRDLKRAQALARRFDPRRMPPRRVTIARANASELNTLLRGALGGVPRAAGRVAVTRYGMVAAVTVETPLPPNPFGRFFNLRATVAPSRSGLVVSRLALGGLEVPAGIVRPALAFALDGLLGAGKGGAALDSIRGVWIDRGVVSVAFRPPPGLVADMKAAAKRQAQIADPERVGAYYDAIVRIHAQTRDRGSLSLVEFVRPLFRLADERSRTGDPVAENRAAILALAQVFGDDRFARLAGTPRRARLPVAHVRLDGRRDFVQHFAVSAGLALAGGGAAATLIGEIKEAQDSGGASGFSFTDIGADRTGVRFAAEATASAKAARRVQAALAAAGGERDFFPSFRDLPEGLGEAAFRRRYGDMDSAAYRKVIAEIDRRIARAPLFRPAPKR